MAEIVVMAEIVIKAIPDQRSGPGVNVVSWILSPRLYFGLMQWSPVGADRRGSVLGVWYECLGDWDRLPEGTIAR